MTNWQKESPAAATTGLDLEKSTGRTVSQGRVSVFDSPELLAKDWSLDGAGELVKTTAANMWRGTYAVREFGDVAGLVALLGGITTRQAISCSLPVDGGEAGEITTQRQRQQGGNPEAKTRTKDEFNLRAGAPGIMVIDHDGETGRDELWGLLVSACPALARAGVVWRPSGSSCIWNGDKEVRGLTGQHFYVMLADASDGPRVLKALAGRLWLAGRGEVVVSRSGAMLLRSPIDEAVADGARLVFAGGAECLEPLSQRRGPPVVLVDGGFLDSRAEVPDLTENEIATVKMLQGQAKSRARPEADLKRAEARARRVQEEAPALAEKERISLEDAGERVGKAFDAAHGGVLLGDFILTVVHGKGQHEKVSVADVLRDRARWHEARTLCPLHPGHRGGAADARLYLKGARPCLYSLDDGGAVYSLRDRKAVVGVSAGMRGEAVDGLVAVCVGSGLLFWTPGGVVSVATDRQVPVSKTDLINFLDPRVLYMRRVRDGSERSADIPAEVAELVLARLRTPGVLPVLRGCVDLPYPTVSGKLVTAPGFNPETGLWLAGRSEFAVPANPGRDEVVRAVAGMMEPWKGYRFTDAAGAGVAVAGVLTALCRGVLDIAPGLLVDAATQGSGKTKLMTAMGALVEGEAPGVCAWSTVEEERKKAVLGAALQGSRTLLFDNVMGTIRSASLAGVLTTGKITDRVLGQSLMISGECRAFMAFSSNNASTDNDMSRRLMKVRIDGGDRPTHRLFEFDPLAEAVAGRVRIAVAACTVWSAYFAAGAPIIVKGDAGGYAAWNRLVRQVVLWVQREGLGSGLPWPELGDPAASMLGQADHVSEEDVQRGALLSALHELSKGEPFTTKELQRWINPVGSDPMPGSTLYELRCLLGEIAGKRPDAISGGTLGKILGNRVGPCAVGFRLTRGGTGKSGYTWTTTTI